MSRCPCEKVKATEIKNKNQCNDKDYKKIKNLKTKNLQAQNLLACQIDAGTITAQTGNFSDLSSNTLSVSNLNVTSINGRNLFCDDDFKISGVITPVEYVNGNPVQPANPGNLNERVLDELWRLNLLANGFTNLDAADTRYKNYLLQKFYNCSSCPEFPPTGCTFSATNVALFNGSVNSLLGTTGSINILTVSEMLPVDIIPGNTEIGIIQIGERVYPQNSETYFIIEEQLTGNPGGIGTYRVSNNFNSSINLPEQRMLALKSNGLEECAAVPLRIYGVETLPYSNLGMSGMTGVNPINTCGTVVVDAINYNINIANKLLNTRVAAVYLQVGWIGSTGGVVVQGLSIDTKQFDLSILSFGEQMNNNFLIPDNIKPDLLTGVVQIAVYVEDGLEVFIPENPNNNRNTNRVNRAIVATPGQPTNYTVSFSQDNSQIIIYSSNQGLIAIPAGTKTLSFKAVGGGGAGGSLYLINRTGGVPVGGGGGSGYEIQISNIDLSTISGQLYLNAQIGKGGAVPDPSVANGADGGSTILSVVDISGNIINNLTWVAAGGKGGESANGGNGQWGGGGGGGRAFDGTKRRVECCRTSWTRWYF